MRFRTLLGALVLAAAAPVLAQDALPPASYADTQLADPAQEGAARDLMETLRCLTCEGQSIADSDAAMAGDMRHAVRTRIAAGESPAAVRGWLVERYGEYISYAPRPGASTWPLFAAPLLLLLAAGALVWRRVRAR